MESTRYSVKRFHSFSNIHRAKPIRYGSCHRHKKKYKTNGSDDCDSLGRNLLNHIAFAAEFTFFCRLGCFRLHAYVRNSLYESALLCNAIKWDKSVMNGTGHRSPPSALVFQKNQTEVRKMKSINPAVFQPQTTVRKNKFQIFFFRFAKIHFSNGIVNEREKERRLAGTEGGELYGAIFFPKENHQAPV